MKNNDIYTIPHTCYLCEFWDFQDGFEYILMGRQPCDWSHQFDAVREAEGFRHIQLIERVRDHWVVDTWLVCGEHATSKQTKLRTHKYLKQLLRASKLQD
jgi:hypothetical protein